jgi:hypothetical protein
MFHLPVVVNWDYFDARLLGRFWASNPERAALRAHLPDNADRILIFVRGVGVAKDSGLFIDQKVGSHGWPFQSTFNSNGMGVELALW